MPNGRAFEHALELSAGMPGLGLGIHVSLVGEKSVAPPHELGQLVDDEGNLPSSYVSFAKGFAARKFGIREVRTEIEAQFARVLDAGVQPTHADSHQHLHVLPGVCDIVLDCARSAGLGVIRIPLESGGLQAGAGRGRRLQATLLSYLSRHTAMRARTAGIRYPDRFWGVGVSGRMTEDNLLETIRRLGTGVNEIMCHPGFSDPETERRYRWHYHWDEEAAGLRSEAVARLTGERGIRLAGFADAWA